MNGQAENFHDGRPPHHLRHRAAGRDGTASASQHSPWAEQRRFWTDAILQGMARLEGLEPDHRLMEQYDQRLEDAHN